VQESAALGVIDSQCLSLLGVFVDALASGRISNLVIAPVSIQVSFAYVFGLLWQ
jgi:hypothetical protein